ncbi:uncharacterized protein LOC130712348 [Lotus japonicus]|uniref:uncharacterized protein LOC130712348 n=1 Tax=Lotus japonicus TaxID=34305 RepID=UPI00258FF833|nr:uncharacterized protein LOC130712348 [Lotus japonicus]
MHCLSWNALCKAKDNGGLGFRDFKLFNSALVAKNWWRIKSNPESLLGKVYRAVYFPRGTIHVANRGYRPSYAWSSIIRSCEIFAKGGMWNIGNGKNVMAWSDKWVPGMDTLVYSMELAQQFGVSFVSDLMQLGLLTWNRELINFICCPPLARAILAIPLPLVPRDDVLYWPFSPDGHYSTKSGYQFLRQGAEAAVASSSQIPSLPRADWRKLWKADALPRCRETGWRACLDVLPVRASLHARGLAPDPTCPRCLAAPETAHHALLFCPTVRPIWFASSLGFRLAHECRVHEFVYDFMQVADESSLGVFLTLLYAIWSARNELCFKDKASTLEQILNHASSLSPLPPLEVPMVPQLHLPHSWSRPSPGTFKLNFDAAMAPNGDAGFGLVARNSRGEVLASACFPHGPVPSSLVAEGLSFRWAIGLAMELGFRCIVFETDCLLLFEAWKRRGGCSIVDSLILDCRRLSSGFDVFNFSFVRRTGNNVADALAKRSLLLGSLVWIEEIPQDLYGLVQSDVMACEAPVSS